LKFRDQLAAVAARFLNTPVTAVPTAPEKQTGPVLEPSAPTRGAILTAALAWSEARKTKNKADAIMRKHRKVLDRTEAGAYGDVTISWVPSNKEVPDMDLIEAVFKKHGLGLIPMKACADSLQVTVNTPADASV
jgi:hypothetical protein